MQIGRPATNPYIRNSVTGEGIALCAIGRRENRYAREWVEHYRILGFDRIIICDNNREGEERFSDVLSNYIESGLVEIIPCHDRDCAQCIMYSAVYRKYGTKYRWMAFFDFDEFLIIPSDIDIHELMQGYEGYDCVLFNWLNYGDNDMLTDDGRSLQERFTEPLPLNHCVQHEGIPDNDHVKCMLRGGLEDVCFYETPHLPSHPRLNCCNSLGNQCYQKPFQPYDHSVAFLKHYITKTCGEWFTNKWCKGTGNKESMEAFRSVYAGRFFKYNVWTPEKESLMRSLTGMPPFREPGHRNVVIVNYNTQHLTDCAIRSLNKHTPGCRVYVFDNSDKEPYRSSFDNVEVIDNTKGHVIDLDKMIESHPDRVPTPENTYGSAKHCRSVEACLDILPDGFLLMDSDVLIKRDITPFFDASCAWTGRLQMHTSRFNVTLPRVLPFICYVNVPMMREHGIHYYDDDKMFALTDRKPDMGYDTGCWFYEECHRLGLPENHIDIYEYILHFGHGSWLNVNEDEWLEENKQYWE